MQNRRWGLALGLALLLLLNTAGALAAEALPTVRVGALSHGSVGWELDVLEHHALDRAQGIDVQVRRFGSGDAAAIALQSGAVDIIVNDWLWVSRQRQRDRPWTFYPWSTAVGAVMVPADSEAEELGDLAGGKLGVAGGPVDKNWLLLRAYYRQRYGKELADRVEPAFGSPPLLNQLALRGRLDGVINYWHYNARLQAAGMRPLLEVEDAVRALGVEQPVPLLGWVFSEDWAGRHPGRLRSFLRASYAAKARLAASDAEWQRLRKATGAEDAATLEALRAGFRAGIPRQFGPPQVAAARRLYRVLAAEGGTALTGGHEELATGTFWLPEGFAPWR